MNSLCTTCVYGPISSRTVGNRLGREKWLFLWYPNHRPPPHTHCFLPSPALAGTARLVTHTGAIIAEGDLHSVTIQPVSCTFITFPRPWMLAPLPLSLSFIRGPGPLEDEMLNSRNTVLTYPIHMTFSGITEF